MTPPNLPKQNNIQHRHSYVAGTNTPSRSEAIKQYKNAAACLWCHECLLLNLCMCHYDEQSSLLLISCKGTGGHCIRFAPNFSQSWRRTSIFQSPLTSAVPAEPSDYPGLRASECVTGHGVGSRQRDRYWLVFRSLAWLRSAKQWAGCPMRIFTLHSFSTMNLLFQRFSPATNSSLKKEPIFTCSPHTAHRQVLR